MKIIGNFLHHFNLLVPVHVHREIYMQLYLYACLKIFLVIPK